MLSFMPARPSKDGGTRRIVSIDTAYRLCMLLIPPAVRAWDLKVGRRRGTVLKGRSLIGGAMERHLMLESAVVMGRAATQLLSNIKML